MARKLDKRSAQPLYAQLKELILERIASQEYAPGQQVPSELALCEELGLSRPTVRQAVAELVSEGILVIHKGRGTFVAAESERIELRGFHPFSFSLLAARSADALRDLRVEQIADDEWFGRLLAQQNPAMTANQTGSAGGCWVVGWQLEHAEQVFAACRSLVPVQLFPELGYDLRKGKRMMDITANKYALLPSKASCKVFVRQATLDEARVLDIPRSAPVLTAQSVMTSRSGAVCEMSTAVLRADLVTLSFDAGRG